MGIPSPTSKKYPIPTMDVARLTKSEVSKKYPLVRGFSVLAFNPLNPVQCCS